MPALRRTPQSARPLERGFAILSAVVLTLLALGLVPWAAAADEWLNFKLNLDETTQLQNEEQIAINPTNPDNMAAVWRDFRLGYRQVGWAYTFDGGATWTEGGLMEVLPGTYPYDSDPGITTDKDGNFYAVILSFVSTSQENGLFVLKSTDGGVSWGEPMTVIDQFPGAFEDKEFLACDRTDSAHEGNLYVVWTRFSFTTQIVHRRSTDGGATWSGTYTVSDANGVQFPIPVVGREGEVYVAWTDYGSSSIKIDVSTNGGVSYGSDKTVTGVWSPSVIIDGGIDAYSSPHMDADVTDGTYSGRLYCAYMDRISGAGDEDIYVRWSDDMGTTWSSRVRVNDDPTNNGLDQFHPWLAVDNLGIVTVVFLDKRDDPANWEYNCYLAQSTDGGATWLPNERISTESSNPSDAFTGRLPGDSTDKRSDARTEDIRPLTTGERAGLLGEYIGVVAWDGVATPIWTDIRNGHQDAYAGYLMIGSGAPEAGWTASASRLTVAPNPADLRGAIRVDGAASGSAALRIIDPAGRVVRTLTAAGGTDATITLRWDGRGADGRSVPSGTYFLRLDSDAGSLGGKVIVVD